MVEKPTLSDDREVTVTITRPATGPRNSRPKYRQEDGSRTGRSRSKSRGEDEYDSKSENDDNNVVSQKQTKRQRRRNSIARLSVARVHQGENELEGSLAAEAAKFKWSLRSSVPSNTKWSTIAKNAIQRAHQTAPPQSTKGEASGGRLGHDPNDRRSMPEEEIRRMAAIQRSQNGDLPPGALPALPSFLPSSRNRSFSGRNLKYNMDQIWPGGRATAYEGQIPPENSNLLVVPASVASGQDQDFPPQQGADLGAMIHFLTHKLSGGTAPYSMHEVSSRGADTSGRVRDWRQWLREALSRLTAHLHSQQQQDSTDPNQAASLGDQTPPDLDLCNAAHAELCRQVGVAHSERLAGLLEEVWLLREKSKPYSAPPPAATPEANPSATPIPSSPSSANGRPALSRKGSNNNRGNGSNTPEAGGGGVTLTGTARQSNQVLMEELMSAKNSVIGEQKRAANLAIENKNLEDSNMELTKQCETFKDEVQRLSGQLALYKKKVAEFTVRPPEPQAAALPAPKPKTPPLGKPPEGYTPQVPSVSGKKGSNNKAPDSEGKTSSHSGGGTNEDNKTQKGTKSPKASKSPDPSFAPKGMAESLLLSREAMLNPGSNPGTPKAASLQARLLVHKELKKEGGSQPGTPSKSGMSAPQEAMLFKWKSQMEAVKSQGDHARNLAYKLERDVERERKRADELAEKLRSIEKQHHVLVHAQEQMISEKNSLQDQVDQLKETCDQNELRLKMMAERNQQLRSQSQTALDKCDDPFNPDEGTSDGPDPLNPIPLDHYKGQLPVVMPMTISVEEGSNNCSIAFTSLSVGWHWRAVDSPAANVAHVMVVSRIRPTVQLMRTMTLDLDNSAIVAEALNTLTNKLREDQFLMICSTSWRSQERIEFSEVLRMVGAKAALSAPPKLNAKTAVKTLVAANRFKGFLKKKKTEPESEAEADEEEGKPKLITTPTQRRMRSEEKRGGELPLCIIACKGGLCAGENIATSMWSGVLVHNPVTGMYDIAGEGQRLYMGLEDMTEEQERRTSVGGSSIASEEYCLFPQQDPLPKFLQSGGPKGGAIPNVSDLVRLRRAAGEDDGGGGVGGVGGAASELLGDMEEGPPPPPTWHAQYDLQRAENIIFQSLTDLRRVFRQLCIAGSVSAGVENIKWSLTFRQFDNFFKSCKLKLKIDLLQAAFNEALGADDSLKSSSTVSRQESSTGSRLKKPTGVQQEATLDLKGMLASLVRIAHKTRGGTPGGGGSMRSLAVTLAELLHQHILPNASRINPCKPFLQEFQNHKFQSALKLRRPVFDMLFQLATPPHGEVVLVTHVEIAGWIHFCKKAGVIGPDLSEMRAAIIFVETLEGSSLNHEPSMICGANGRVYAKVPDELRMERQQFAEGLCRCFHFIRQEEVGTLILSLADGLDKVKKELEENSDEVSS